MKTLSIGVVDQNPDSPGEVPRPKLSASEKRKAQNRAAQRTYRLKRIARLKELENIAASAGLLNDPKSPPTFSLANDEKKASLEASNVTISAATHFSGTTSPEQIIETNALTLWKDDFDQEFDSSWPTLQDAQTTLTLQPYTTPVVSSSQDVVPFMLSWERGAFQHQTSTSSLAGSEFTDLTSFTSKDNYCTDPYANHLRLHSMSFMLACQINGQVLGIPDILNYCDEDLVSPFFNPEAPNKPQVLDFALSQYRNMKRDLRPNIVQITTSHHPYATLSELTPRAC
jgi:hypothetical protein